VQKLPVVEPDPEPVVEPLVEPVLTEPPEELPPEELPPELAPCVANELVVEPIVEATPDEPVASPATSRQQPDRQKTSRPSADGRLEIGALFRPSSWSRLPTLRAFR
jgi:hypothetical protein